MGLYTEDLCQMKLPALVEFSGSGSLSTSIEGQSFSSIRFRCAERLVPRIVKVV